MPSRTCGAPQQAGQPHRGSELIRMPRRRWRWVLRLPGQRLQNLRERRQALVVQKWSFVHIPKCGGTTIIKMADKSSRVRRLQQPYTGRQPPPFHALAAEMRAHIGTKAWRAAHTFAIVRNPYDWALSQFFFSAKVHCTRGDVMDAYATESPACLFKPYLLVTPQTRNRSGVPYGTPRPTRRMGSLRRVARGTRRLERVMAESKGNTTTNRFVGQAPRRPRVAGPSAEDARAGFMAGNRIATQLKGRPQSRRKATSQRAWLTGDDDQDILVDRVVKLEDTAAYDRVATEAEILAELCGAPMRGNKEAERLAPCPRPSQPLRRDGREIVARRFAVDFGQPATTSTARAASDGKRPRGAEGPNKSFFFLWRKSHGCDGHGPSADALLQGPARAVPGPAAVRGAAAAAERGGTSRITRALTAPEPAAPRMEVEAGRARRRASACARSARRRSAPRGGRRVLHPRVARGIPRFRGVSVRLSVSRARAGWNLSGSGSRTSTARATPTAGLVRPRAARGKRCLIVAARGRRSRGSATAKSCTGGAACPAGRRRRRPRRTWRRSSSASTTSRRGPTSRSTS